MTLRIATIGALACVLAGVSVAADTVRQTGAVLEPPLEWVPGELIIGFESAPSADELDAIDAVLGNVHAWRTLPHAPHAKGQPGVPHPLESVRIITVPDDQDIVALAARVELLAGVAFAEPNYVTHIALHPNDPFYDTQQYGPQKVNAEAAWDITLGDASVVLAVADTGYNYTHEDLGGAIWVNDDPINGVDDDGNGFIDDINGWDFYNNDNNMLDQNQHGSHVSGIAAARTNNGVGIAGMAQVSIMPLQVFSSGGSGTWDAIANAIFYATDNDAHVLNYSGGGSGGSALLQQAVDYAFANNFTVVAAAGNFNSSSPFYPAAYDTVIAVSGTDRFDNRYSSSNFGNWIDVAAPAVNVFSLSCCGTNAYTTLTGTSMASPHVAGLVALMMSLDPTLTPIQVRDLLRDNAVDLGTPGFDQYFGYGRIDALATLSAMGGGPPPLTCDDVSIMRAFCFNGRLLVTVRMVDSSNSGRTLTIDVNGAPHDVVINGMRAVLNLPDQAGPQTVTLVEPAGCLAPIDVNCN